ncbi:MAG: hypothetical protein JST12_03015 [Armatimonadetes bacterium]|nr:hypothetical protein [Armatimonadota bacterium]
MSSRARHRPPAARTLKQVRFYVAYSVFCGYRIIDQDDQFSTWIDGLSMSEAQSLCQMLNGSEGDNGNVK